MKISQLLFIYIVINYFVYAQQHEWVLFSNPSLIFKSVPGIYLESIAIGGNNEKQFANDGSLKNSGTKWIQTSLHNPGVLPDNYILCMAQEGNGDIWIGTNSGGLARFDGANWTVYNSSNSGLPVNTVYSIAVEENGTKWIGTTAGLVKYDGTKWRVYRSSKSELPNNIIYSVAIDEFGIKWIGTLGGLAKFNDKKWIIYKSSRSKLPENSVTSVTIGADGTKWIGTFAGLAKFDDEKWTVYKTSNSLLPYNDIYSTTSDPDGGINIQTWGGGFAELKGRKWTLYNVTNSKLPDNNVSSLVIDGSGDKWIGTLNGLAKLSGKFLTVFKSSTSPLPDNKVYSLLFDKSGNLWIGTQNGLALFKKGGVANIKAGLTAFSSQLKSGKVNLKWKSAQGTNSYGFEIERKLDNHTWERIGFLAGQAENSSKGNYSFVDEDPVSGKVSYRLRQWDSEFKYRYSEIIGDSLNLPAELLVGNIPVNHPGKKINIKFSLPRKSVVTIEIYNAFGMAVGDIKKECGAGFNMIQFNTAKMIPGFYFYRISTDQFSSLRPLPLLN